MFEGKIAVITGAARGIGQAIAWNLAKEGADIVLCDIKEEWLAETAEGIKKPDGKSGALSSMLPIRTLSRKHSQILPTQQDG